MMMMMVVVVVVVVVVTLSPKHFVVNWQVFTISTTILHFHIPFTTTGTFYFRTAG